MLCVWMPMVAHVGVPRDLCWVSGRNVGPVVWPMAPTRSIRTTLRPSPVGWEFKKKKGHGGGPLPQQVDGQGIPTWTRPATGSSRRAIPAIPTP